MSASESHRWIYCPGSVALCEGQPRYSNPAAVRGTAAHALAAGELQGDWDAHKRQFPGLLGMTFRFEDDGVTKTETVDQKMLDGVMVYVDHVRDLANNPHSVVFLEQTVSLEHVHPGMYGTADCIILKQQELVVIDYKNGATPVYMQDEDGEPNSQLMFYAAGAMHFIEQLADILDYEVPAIVTMKIVQPNSFEVPPIQTLTVSANELRLWARTTLYDAAVAASEPNAELVPGDQCKWCLAQAVCPAFADKASSLASIDFKELSGETPAEKCKRIAKESSQRYLEKHRDDPEYKKSRVEATQKWREKNPDHLVDLRIEVLEAYGGKCVCCGESNLDFLTLDHVNNDGHLEEYRGGPSQYYKLKRDNWPSNIQILCYNCNCARATNVGICPHQEPGKLMQKKLPPAAMLTRKQVANVLRWAPLLDSWLREVELRAFEELQRGEEYPGFKLVRKKTNRAWPTEDPKRLKALLVGAGMPAKTDIFKEPEVLSPAQLEKLIKDKAVVAKVAVKPEGGMTMAASSDPREAVTVGGDFKELE